MDETKASGAGKSPQADNRMTGGEAKYVIMTGTTDGVTIREEAPPRLSSPRRRARQKALFAVLGAVVAAILVAAGAAAYRFWPPEGAARGGGERVPAAAPGRASASATPSVAPSSSAPRGPAVAEAPASAPVRETPHEAPSSARPGQPDDDEPPPKSPPDAPFTDYETTTPGTEIVDGPACGSYFLCAYRSAGHEDRFDFRAPESDSGGTCYSFPSGDPGFVAVVNGRRYSYHVFERPRCEGESRTLATHNSHQDLPFRFRSYTKA
ncbi:hypothetical protein ACWGJ2_12745 [Streptomyces sp. NPDC054796]